MTNLDKNFDQLFSGERKIDSGQAEKFLDIIRENMSQAEKKSYHRLLLIALVWLFGFGVAEHSFKEASFFAVKLDQLEIVMPIIPVLLAALFYGAVTTMCLQTVYLFSLRRIVQHNLPSIYENSLDKLMYPVSFLSAEIIFGAHLKGRANKLVWIWRGILITLALIAPIGAIVHSSYLTFTSGSVPLWVSIVCILVAIVVIVRAIILFFQWNVYVYNEPHNLNR